MLVAFWSGLFCGINLPPLRQTDCTIAQEREVIISVGAQRFYYCCCSSAVLSSRLVIHGKGPTKMQQALNPAIYEFACLFPYLILFLKINLVNKQISYPRLYKTNQLTRDSESKRLHKISNAEFRTCSGFTWKMPDPS